MKNTRTNIFSLLKDAPQSKLMFLGFAALMLLSLFVGIAGEWYFLAGIPPFLLLAYLTLVDFRFVFFLLLACIPISTEIVLPNGFGTDLPTEPLMIGLMGAFFLYVAKNSRHMDGAFLRHPITLILMLHVAWIFTTTITSDLLLVSLKFSLAKVWYVVVFFFLAGHLLKTEKDIKLLFWVIFIPLMMTVFITLIRHSTYGFSFKDIHKVLHPFQRNHVNYAADMALFFPFVVLALQWYKKWTWKWWVLALSLPILLGAIYLSFTRAAYVALLIALGFYFVMRFRLVKPALVALSIAALVGIFKLANNNTYLEYAPNYERTVSHKQFDNLIEATSKLEDISTMERVYRWVAGTQMGVAHPWMGFGPGNFINFYKKYTVTSFRTYVSDNEDKSGIHSYFLMTLVEQGMIGLLILIVLLFYALIKAEQVYHETSDAGRRRILLMFILAMIVIDSFNLINDLLETDKVGPFFFMGLAVLINVDLANQRSKSLVM